MSHLNTSPLRTAVALCALALSALAAPQNPAPQNPAQTPDPATEADPNAATARPLTGQDGEAAPPPVRLNRLGQTVLSPRIASITRLGNSMPHYLSGIGLVTGLPQTGSSDVATRQAIINFCQQNNFNISRDLITSKTTALVSLTCELPPFAKLGQRLDVHAEVITDATSLRGGTLQRAVLQGVDGETYVVAQGKLRVAGYTAQGQNASISKNPSASARLINGGLVTREENTSFFSESGAIELTLVNPTPFNSMSVASGISTALEGMDVRVQAIDPSTVRIVLPEAQRQNSYAQQLLAMVANVRVPVENPTKVVVDVNSGTVLAGEGVLISPCAVTISELTITIVEEDFVSQPNPLSNGETASVGRTRIETETTSTGLQPLGGAGATVSDLLQNLRSLGLTAEQLVSVFEALDQGGFLQAQLEIH